MSGVVGSYNSEVLAEACSKCGATFPSRCHGSVGQITKAHKARLDAAGYKWDAKNYVLRRKVEDEGREGSPDNGARQEAGHDR